MQVYIYQAAIYCEECGEKIREDLTAKGEAPEDVEDEGSYDSDDFPKGPTEEGESDTPSHCDACACFLETDLTEEGRKYVAEKVREGRERNEVFTPPRDMPVAQLYGGPGQFSRPSEEWADFYGIGGEEDEEEDEEDGVEDEDDGGDIEEGKEGW